MITQLEINAIDNTSEERCIYTASVQVMNASRQIENLAIIVIRFNPDENLKEAYRII